MVPRTSIVIDFGRHRLRALLAERRGDRLRIKRVLLETVPADLDTDDPAAVGSWIGACLSKAGFPKRNATIAVAREHVGLKRLRLPSTDDHELPSMVHLALQRDLPFDAQTAVIDYVPVGRDETGTTVVAMAVPDSALSYATRAAAAAGIGVARISLRSMGTAALLSSLGGHAGESALAVDVVGEGVEFCVVVNGSIRFARAAEAPREEPADVFAETVVTETRRTWMSYRITEDADDVDFAVVMGDRRVAEQSVKPLHEMLQVDTEVLDSHPLIDTNGHDMDRLWPLAGLLLEPILGVESIDFAHPRKAPDLAARRRKRMLFAAGVGIVALFGGWTMASFRIEALQDRLDALEAEEAKYRPRYIEIVHDNMHLTHLRQWDSVRPDWLAHARFLADLTPAPGDVVLDAWQGSLDFRGVEFDRRAADEQQKWSAPQRLTFVIDGEAKDRATADAFRETLVRSDLYQASSTGADASGGKRLPFGFTYRLTSRADAPADARRVADGSSSARKEDGS